MTDRASAEGHRYDHDGMHRHHHEYGPTGRAIWWEYADQFGGDLTEHTHAVSASTEGLPDGICDITGARHPDLVSRKDVAALRADRASAEGLHTLAPHDGCRSEDCEVEALVRRLALRDTGPRPDSGIEALREAAYYAVETWVMYDVDEERMAALEKALGRSVGLENASLNDVRAALDARLSTPRTKTHCILTCECNEPEKHDL